MATKAPAGSEQLRRKQETIAEIRERFDAADAAVLTEYRGLTVGELAELRASLRGASTEFKVFKNSLARRACEESGRDDLVPLLDGPVAIAFVAGDAVTAAKALTQFAKTSPALVVKGAVLGEQVLGAGDVEALALVPPRDELLARLAGAFKAPMARTASALSGLQRKLAHAVKAYIDARVDAGEAAPAAEEPEADAGAEEAEVDPGAPEAVEAGTEAETTDDDGGEGERADAEPDDSE